MAYVPDEAIQLLNDLSPTAGQLYLFFCRWRDHGTGYSRKKFDTACAEHGVSKATFYRVRGELLRDKTGRSWVTLDDMGRVGLLVGDFSCVDKTPAATSVWKGGERRHQPPNVLSLKPETVARHDAEDETKVLKPDTPSLKAETGRIEDRARFFQQTTHQLFHPAAAVHALRGGRRDRRCGRSQQAVLPRLRPLERFVLCPRPLGQ